MPSNCEGYHDLQGKYALNFTVGLPNANFFPKVRWSLATHRKTHGKWSTHSPFPRLGQTSPEFQNVWCEGASQLPYIPRTLKKKTPNQKSLKNTDILPYLTFDLLIYSLFFLISHGNFHGLDPLLTISWPITRAPKLAVFPSPKLHESAPEAFLQWEQRNCEGGFVGPGKQRENFPSFQPNWLKNDTHTYPNISSHEFPEIGKFIHVWGKFQDFLAKPKPCWTEKHNSGIISHHFPPRKPGALQVWSNRLLANLPIKFAHSSNKNGMIYSSMYIYHGNPQPSFFGVITHIYGV